MNLNDDFYAHLDRHTNAVLIDMMENLETATLNERLSFLYEVTGVILLNAISQAEKDGRPSEES